MGFGCLVWLFSLIVEMDCCLDLGILSDLMLLVLLENVWFGWEINLKLREFLSWVSCFGWVV